MMEETLFARFYTPGAIVADTRDVAIQTINPRLIDWPRGAYAFEIIEKREVTDKDGFVLKGERCVDNKIYYHPDSIIQTRIDVLSREGDSILYQNMMLNNWSSVIFTRWGNWPQPYNPERDVVLPKKSE